MGMAERRRALAGNDLVWFGSQAVARPARRRLAKARYGTAVSERWALVRGVQHGPGSHGQPGRGLVCVGVPCIVKARSAAGWQPWSGRHRQGAGRPAWGGLGSQANHARVVNRGKADTGGPVAQSSGGAWSGSLGGQPQGWQRLARASGGMAGLGSHGGRRPAQRGNATARQPGIAKRRSGGVGAGRSCFGTRWQPRIAPLEPGRPSTAPHRQPSQGVGVLRASAPSHAAGAPQAALSGNPPWTTTSIFRTFSGRPAGLEGAWVTVWAPARARRASWMPLWVLSIVILWMVGVMWVTFPQDGGCSGNVPENTTSRE